MSKKKKNDAKPAFILLKKKKIDYMYLEKSINPIDGVWKYKLNGSLVSAQFEMFHITVSPSHTHTCTLSINAPLQELTLQRINKGHVTGVTAPPLNS